MKSKRHIFSKMAVRLWMSMMVLVLFTIGVMWVVQIFVLERNYTNMTIKEMQERLQPVMEELSTEDLTDDEELLSYLSRTANGKMLIVDHAGELMGMYRSGHPIDLEKDKYEIRVWEDIQSSNVYQSIVAREKYSRENRKGASLVSYEMGIPALYGGEPAYVILYQTFAELEQVLKVNRKQLIILSVLLTLISAGLAAALSRKFIKPIHIIKATVDELTKGNLTAKPDIQLKDEVGQLAQAVIKLGEALQRVDSLRKEVIANVSHELRSPLSLIGGYAEMVRDIHWKEEEKRNDDLDLIIRESKRMSEMVSDILDYSQLQSGYLQIHRDWYNLYEIVESEVMLCGESASEYGIGIRLSFHKKEMPVFVDALKISQVVRNLLYNAVNHTKDGTVIIVELTESGTCYRVAVKNEGEPIPNEERPLIWERYQRCQHQGGRKEGTGIGLSIVSTILIAHGMDYGVEYQDGRNVFWFECKWQEG